MKFEPNNLPPSSGRINTSHSLPSRSDWKTMGIQDPHHRILKSRIGNKGTGNVLHYLPGHSIPPSWPAPQVVPGHRLQLSFEGPPQVEYHPRNIGVAIRFWKLDYWNDCHVMQLGLPFVLLNCFEFGISCGCFIVSLRMQAAAAMCVGMGSFSDPFEAQGLAHFLGLLLLQLWTKQVTTLMYCCICLHVHVRTYLHCAVFPANEIIQSKRLVLLLMLKIQTKNENIIRDTS